LTAAPPPNFDPNPDPEPGPGGRMDNFFPGGRPTAAFVDLDILAANFRSLSESIGSQRGVLAVVKAEAYGHGAAEAATAFIEAGAAWLGVATVEEGEQLRKVPAAAGDAVRVLVMSGAFSGLASRTVAAGLDAVVWNLDQAEALSAATSAVGQRARIHVKVDSGMRRLGIPPGEAAEFLARAGKLKGVEIAGLMSHLARADEEDGAEATEAQFEVIRALLDDFRAKGVLPAIVHAANSAGALAFPDAPGGMVRAGIALYGCPPVPAPGVDLRPAMTLKSAIVQVREVAANEAVGYGGIYSRSAAGRVAVVPIGYADGYPRLLSNRADVLVRGRRVPVAGRVSMDMLTIDVSGIEDASVGDEVVLIGAQGTDHIACEELAARSETITYEILSRLGVRVPRIFLKDGRAVGSRILGGGPP